LLIYINNTMQMKKRFYEISSFLNIALLGLNLNIMAHF